MSKLNVGIVGLGSIAKSRHVPILSSFKDVEIKAAAELNAESGKKFVKKWNIPQIFEDYNEMYKESGLDAVFICLPSHLHFEAAKSAIEHGIHVFCEKPMGLRSDNAFELVKEAEKRNLVLAVGYNRRLAENYEKADEIVRSLKLGKILQAHAVFVMAGPYFGWVPSSDWFFDDKFGVLYDLGSHLVDLILYILSDRITEVSALGIKSMHELNVYDNIACVFRTEEEVTGTLNTGWKIPQDCNAIEVHGTAGSLFVNPLELEVRHGSYDSLERAAYHLKSARSNLRISYDNETYVREDRAFMDAVKGNASPLVSGVNGLRVLEVLDAIKESLESRKTRKVCFHEL